MSRIAVALVALFLATVAQGQACSSRLFVSAYFTTVHVYDACTGAYLRNLDASGRIRGAQTIRLGPDGLLYVTSEMSQQILRYRNDTLEFVDVFATVPGSDPTGFAFAPNGDVYLAAFRTDDVRRLSSAGVPLDIPVAAGAGSLDGPDNGITFAADGNLYVPGYYSSNVIRHDPRTGATTAVVARGAAGLRNTRGLLPVKGEHALWVTGEGSAQLLKLDLGTGTLTVAASGLFAPTGIAYGVDGDLLIADGDIVARHDPATGARKGIFMPSDPVRLASVTYLAVVPVPGPTRATVVEFRHAGLDHYFVSALAADIDALDSGALQGWVRTGATFGAYLQPAPGTQPVCRFYLPPAHGDSHFYSASPAECADVRARFPAFAYESGEVMYIALPDVTTGDCPDGTVKVYRLWNQRADSNHRYTSDPSVKAAMLAQGYLAEGYGPDATIMCAPV